MPPGQLVFADGALHTGTITAAAVRIRSITALQQRICANLSGVVESDGSLTCQPHSPAG